jgi:SP family xylose:H+ symportor-like MFS transporter
MIVGSIGYIIGLAGAAYAFYAKVEGCLLLVSLLIFIAAHGFGQGAVIWVLLVMPETKGVSLEKIQEKLGID